MMDAELGALLLETVVAQDLVKVDSVNGERLTEQDACVLVWSPQAPSILGHVVREWYDTGGTT